MKKLFTWKVLRRLLICFVGFITLVAVVWAVENFRGKRAWNKYQAELKAKGETLDIAALIPPAVPDAQNFALIPFFDDLGYAPNSTAAVTPKPKPDLVRIVMDWPDTVGSQQRWTENGVNLQQMQEYFRSNTNFPKAVSPQSPAEDVLLALSRFDADLKGLDEAAAQRPFSRFPVRYENGFSTLLPHFLPLRHANWVLLLRSTANLELGRGKEALKDTELGFRLSDSIKGEPLLISHLVRIALYRMNVQIVKEGLNRHAWDDTDLARLQELLGSADLLKEYQQAIRGERAYSTSGIETIMENDSALREVTGTQDFLTGKFMPRGWIHQNQLWAARWLQDYMIPIVDPANRRVRPETAAKATDAMDEMLKQFTPYTMFAKLMVPAVTKVSIRTTEIHTQVDQAIIACALERFYVANKSYPETLPQLVPKHLATLPHDAITGEPMKYQRTTDGSYKLYSVGWDGQDNGGLPALTDKPSRNEEAGRDWVW